MRWLSMRKPSGNDRGVIAVMFALVVAGGLMLGMLALTVDTGRLFVERRAVQNGADAAAMALAQDCALDLASCAPNAASTNRAGLFANVNAKDGTSTVSSVCGSAPFAACVAPRVHEWECRNASAYSRFVRVNTATREDDGTAVIPPVFSDILQPNPGTGLWACAQAVWGTANGAAGIVPFALSICDFLENGTKVAVSFANNSSTRSCTVTDADGVARSYTSALSGLTYYTKMETTFNCVTPVPINVGDWLTRQNVASTQQVCGSPQPSARLDALVGTAIYLPMVGNVATSGQGSYPFQVISFAQLQLIGYWLQNQNTSGGTPPPGTGSAIQRWRAAGCTSGVACLYGTFTNGVTVGSVVPGGPNTGAIAVQLIP